MLCNIAKILGKEAAERRFRYLREKHFNSLILEMSPATVNNLCSSNYLKSFTQ